MSTQLFGAMSAEGIEVRTNRATKPICPSTSKTARAPSSTLACRQRRAFYDPRNEKIPAASASSPT